ncbi:MAG TPA: two-component regulator propeller domain-containing protein, partial [Bacteroidales bacterium]|nr:two-component regulator propeller domain-containing protein [Bacteroidales bacterium]
MNHYTASNGLSSNIVRCIFQDSRGFIWAGTEGGGLNKFDGYRFTIYDYRSDNPHSLSNSQVYAMAEDHEGNIWVGTHNGLNKLDVKTGRFQRYFNDPLHANSLKSNRVSALYVDKDNVLWIGTFLGLQKLDIQKNRFTDYSAKMTNQDGRPEKTVNAIVEDSKGNLWLGVWWGGLKKFSKATGVFTDYYADPKNPDGLLNNNVLSLCIDLSENLWIGNHTGGLRKFSIHSGQFLPLKKPEKNVSIWSICMDGDGRICYTRAGIGFVNTSSNHFETLDYSKDEPEGISSGYHYAVFTDRAGMLWLGSTEGLSFYSPLNKRFASYLKLIDTRKRYYITTFYKRPGKQEIWFGTFGNGIIRLNENTGKTLRIYYGNNDDQSLPD